MQHRTLSQTNQSIVIQYEVKKMMQLSANRIKHVSGNKKETLQIKKKYCGSLTQSTATFSNINQDTHWSKYDY